ncbi:MAG: methyltransferase [Acidobacteria bacterium]|nr:methyltransferase [Acidobacteriota bacterium]
MARDSRSIVRRALTFDSPARIPRQTWILPWAEKKHPAWVRRLRRNYPDDIIPSPGVYKKPLHIIGGKYTAGQFVDEWGCRFENPQEGVMGIVREPVIKNWDDLESWNPPPETLTLDTESVNGFCRNTDCFVYAGSWLRPLERFQFLRTMEQSLIDLIEEPPELEELLNRIHSHYLKEAELWAKTDVDAIALMDDWGTQTGLLASPETFRRLFLPMYRDYSAVAHAAGKFLFMHSDGWITDIIPDLIKAGVDALNAQVFCMGVENLGRLFKGRITFWGEMDRQHLLPNGSEDEIAAAVHQLHASFFDRGGVIAQCEFGLQAKPENVMYTQKTWSRF